MAAPQELLLPLIPQPAELVRLDGVWLFDHKLHTSVVHESLLDVARHLATELDAAGNDAMFAFPEGVLDQVVALFRGRYFHVGRDEAPKYRWNRRPKCRQRMAEEELSSAEELQAWFVWRSWGYLHEHRPHRCRLG